MKFWLSFILPLAIVLVALFFWRSAESSHVGESKKVSSGLTFEKETVVQKTPSVSAAATGFDVERVWSGQDDWEPAIAADPGSTYVYQMTTRYSGPKACNGCPFPVIIFRASSDSGATWGSDRFLPITKNKQNDPMIAVASDGTIYIAWLDNYRPGVKFIKSGNHGASWTTPISFTPRGGTPNWSDRPLLAISRDGKDVYVAFNASDSYVVASHNYGATFSAPVKTNSDTRYWFHTGGAVASNGAVYIATSDFSQDYTGDANISVLKSTNGGVSWTTNRVDVSAELPGCSWAAGCYFGFLGTSPALAVDGNGTIMIAYSANTVADAPQSMWIRTSTDGVTWSARHEVSNGSSSVNNNFPALAATGNGDFRLAWQDDRNGATNEWNTWYRRTTNGGNTWSTALRLSDAASGAPYKDALGYRFPYGDYFEIAIDSTGRNLIIWGEGISYTGPGGTWYTRGQ